MPEVRRDPISGRWTIFSPERALRPIDLVRESTVRSDSADACPFCPGAESATPHELFALRDGHSGPNQPGWRVRVVANRYPALTVEEVPSPAPVGIFDRDAGVGAHEVIIETPEHATPLEAHSVEHVADVFAAYRERLIDLKRDTRLISAVVFKNKGAAAGASLSHPHSQLIASPFVPPELQGELDRGRAWYQMRSRCVFCDLIAQERAAEERIVRDANGFVTCCPYASRFPFEQWVLPSAHASHFEEIADADLHGLAAAVKDALTRLHSAVGDPAYNLVLHTAPFDRPNMKAYHWHVEILPRLTNMAGYELGGGGHINTVLPEEAARVLRTSL